jgi:hypothetical protein
MGRSLDVIMELRINTRMSSALSNERKVGYVKLPATVRIAHPFQENQDHKREEDRPPIRATETPRSYLLEIKYCHCG